MSNTEFPSALGMQGLEVTVMPASLARLAVAIKIQPAGENPVTGFFQTAVRTVLSCRATS